VLVAHSDLSELLLRRSRSSTFSYRSRLASSCSTRSANSAPMRRSVVIPKTSAIAIALLREGDDLPFIHELIVADETPMTPAAKFCVRACIPSSRMKLSVNRWPTASPVTTFSRSLDTTSIYQSTVMGSFEMGDDEPRSWRLSAANSHEGIESRAVGNIWLGIVNLTRCRPGPARVGCCGRIRAAAAPPGTGAPRRCHRGRVPRFLAKGSNSKTLRSRS
jgi:hypothetical protein